MRLLTSLLALVCLALPASAQPAYQSSQLIDEELAKPLKEGTTKPEFISPLVDHLPKSATVPSPKDVIGHYIGEPKKLTYYADLIKYYRALASKSPRVKIVEIGESDEHRPSIVVFVSSEENI